MKTAGYLVIFIFVLLAGSALSWQKAPQADAARALLTPALGTTATASPGTLATTAPASTTPLAGDETVALLWEGDPLPDDGQAECQSLRLMVDGQAFIGPCGAADNPVEMAAGQPNGWPEMVIRFAPVTTETIQGRIEFQGQGQIMSPAWQRAIATWAQFTYNELASGRVSAAGRTVMSWFLGEVPEQPGLCRQLVVLSHGYAYRNITPCAGGNVQETVGGWLDTAEWDKFDTWLTTYAPVYAENNYLSGLGATEMSEAEVAEVADWAGDVYTRLQNEVAALPIQSGSGAASTTPSAEAAGCPEAAAGTQLLLNPEHGYCLLYPAGYMVENPNENETVLVVGSLLNVEDPRLHIEVAEAQGRTVMEVAEQLEANFGVPGVEIKQSTATVGGEEAIVLDNVPGQDINRRVVFTHNGRLYSLMFAPVSPEAGPANDRLEEFYNLVLNSFTFLDQP